MLEAIIDIGDSILCGMSLIESRISEVAIRTHDKQQKERYVCKIDFDLESEQVKIDTSEEIDSKSALKYLYLGREGGANNAQWLVTFPGLNYLFTHVPMMLKGKKISDELNQLIGDVLNKFYLINVGENKRDLFIINGECFNIDFNQISLPEDKKKARDAKINKIEKSIYEEKELSKNQIGLYTLCINGKPIVLREDYRKFVEDYFINESQEKTVKLGRKKEKTHNNKVCSFCGQEDTNSLNVGLKIFTQNQVIFASELDKKRYAKHNYQLCKACNDKLIAGEKYIISNLNTKIAKITTLVIPHVLIGNKNTREHLKDLSDKAFNRFNILSFSDSIERIRKIHMDQDNILNDYSGDDYYYLLNFLIYKHSNSSDKMKRLIKDVQPSRLIEIETGLLDAIDFISRFNWKFTWLNLNSLYYSVPIYEKDGEAKNYRFILDLYSAIFNNQSIDKLALIRQWNKVFKILFFNQKGFNISQNDKDKVSKATILEGKIREIISVYKFLININTLQVKGGEQMEMNVKDNLRMFINEMQYNEQQACLFLLGILMGEIGRAQGKRNKDGNKAILNKINFNGMDYERIVKLTVEVFNKLKQEKLLKFHENTYFEVSALLTRNKEKWLLTKTENLFYLLTGFGFRDYQEKDKENGGNNDE